MSYVSCRPISALLPTLAKALVLVLVIPASALAASEPPIKENVASHIGWEVNGTTHGNVCAVASGNNCQPGRQSTEPSGFWDPNGVAVNDDPTSVYYHDLYVADGVTDRVTILSPSGQVITTFGSKGTAAGNLSAPAAITVDPANGNVYVIDHPSNSPRVQEFTAEGTFVSKVGESFADPEALAVGPDGVLYIGEEGRVQELEADGKHKGEISLKAISSEPNRTASAIAIDSSGDLYVIYQGIEIGRNIIYKVAPGGQVVDEFELSPRELGAEVQAATLALDPAGRLAVVEYESNFQVNPAKFTYRGVLYDTVTGKLHAVTEFQNPSENSIFASEGVKALSFNDKDEMFATAFNLTGLGYFAAELIAYAPSPVGELLTGVTSCKSGTEDESDVTLNCVLNGQVDPWGVSETEVWFESGISPNLGTVGVHQPVASKGPEGTQETPVGVTDLVEGLRPNQSLDYRVTGRDHNAKAPETLTSEIVLFKTQSEPPRIIGAPSTSFVKSFSADILGDLNPENTSTEYYAEYAPEIEGDEPLAARCPQGAKGPEKCDGIGSTASIESNEYGRIGATLEATELQPGTNYRYRLFARNAAGQSAVDERGGGKIQEGTFRTVAAPAPQAESGTANQIGTTSATIIGNVNPDGQPAVYVFQIGLYNDVETRFGTIISASAGSGMAWVAEQEALTGLQPGTTYAYRIGISSAYGTSYGAARVFTTVGLPATLVVSGPVVMLPVPPISFPAKPKTTPSCKHGYARSRQGKCVKVKRKPAKKVRKARAGNARGKDKGEGGARR
jgi:hypothetical protein